jgi:hypothetical protein
MNPRRVVGFTWIYSDSVGPPGPLFLCFILDQPPQAVPASSLRFPLCPPPLGGYLPATSNTLLIINGLQGQDPQQNPTQPDTKAPRSAAVWSPFPLSAFRLPLFPPRCPSTTCKAKNPSQPPSQPSPSPSQKPTEPGDGLRVLPAGHAPGRPPARGAGAFSRRARLQVERPKDVRRRPFAQRVVVEWRSARVYGGQIHPRRRPSDNQWQILNLQFSIPSLPDELSPNFWLPAPLSPASGHQCN